MVPESQVMGRPPSLIVVYLILTTTQRRVPSLAPLHSSGYRCGAVRGITDIQIQILSFCQLIPLLTVAIFIHPEISPLPQRHQEAGRASS